MSTDYGFGCETCGRGESDSLNARVTMTNCRDPEALGKLLQFPSVSKMIEAFEKVDDGRWYDVTDAALFVVKHRAQGHVVRVCDAYSRWDDQCRKDVLCSRCVKRHACSLKPDHEGDCATFIAGKMMVIGGDEVARVKKLEAALSYAMHTIGNIMHLVEGDDKEEDAKMRERLASWAVLLGETPRMFLPRS